MTASVNFTCRWRDMSLSTSIPCTSSRYSSDAKGTPYFCSLDSTATDNLSFQRQLRLQHAAVRNFWMTGADSLKQFLCFQMPLPIVFPPKQKTNQTKKWTRNRSWSCSVAFIRKVPADSQSSMINFRAIKIVRSSLHFLRQTLCHANAAACRQPDVCDYQCGCNE